MKFDNDKVIFIHIPRTAGTYIERQLCKKYNCVKKWPVPNEKNLFGLYKINDDNYLTLQHLTIKEMIKYQFINKNPEDQFIFTIIRNPYDRVVSLYKNWFKRYETLDIFLDELKKLNLDKYQHNGIVTNNKNFNYKNMTSNLSEIKYFVLPQYYYIDNNENYKVNIIKYDEIESLNEILNLNVKYIKSENKNLTEIQKNKIYNIYKIDFDQFNFER
tara:strand:- start:540 stop:1187 length:648 start_codon:yes stop_codon:yes gene_type:complete